MNTETRRRGAARPAVLGLVSVAAIAVYLVATKRSDESRYLFFDGWRTRDFFVVLALTLAAITCFASALSRKLAFAVVLSIVLGALTVGLLEFVGAIGLVSYPRLFGTTSEVLGSKPIVNEVRSGETYEDLAYAWGYPAQPIAFHYATDRRGFRNAKDHAAPEVVLVGDSILVAGLLPAGETVSGRIEAATRVPTSNIALIGLSVREERAYLAKAVAEGMSLRDRLVLQFVFEGNDLVDAVSDGEPAGELTWRERSLVNNVLLRLQRASDPTKPEAMRRFGRLNDETYLFMWGAQTFDGLEPQFDAVTADLLTAQAMVREAGGTYGVVFVPAKMRVVGPLCSWPPESTLRDHRPHVGWFRERLVGWGRDGGVPVLDLTDPLVAAARGGRVPWFAGDTHPNAVGHEVFAREILGWAPVRRWLDARAARTPTVRKTGD